ncbi:mitochondrial 54S ribosomal protein rml2 [Coemansia sp. RSA 2559]|nr:mitochondrial 54S ribosomal protein rml2 [Coemansia sp. RSA 2559]KAJ2848737.1 mitochondrial 54S ribosomal protein rml2 [Coemansia erecta]
MLAIRRGLLGLQGMRLAQGGQVRLTPGGPGMARQAMQGPQVRLMSNTKDDGQFKTWRPLAPTLRQRRMVSRKHLHKGGPERALTVAKRRSGGRNGTGQITCRHRGGGAKRRIRLVDFKRSEPGPQQVVRLEYDPGRSAHIALIQHMETKKKSYILAPAGLKPGAVVQSYMGVDLDKLKKAPELEAEEEEGGEEGGAVKEAANRIRNQNIQHPDSVAARISLEVGNCMPLKLVPMGATIHNVGLHAFGRGQMMRSAGASAQLLYTAPKGLAQIKLASGEVRRVSVDACATIGQVSNPNHKHEKLGGAGAKRRRGWRPTVRGTAMNTHDHPHGGGRGKSKGNKHPRSPWGKLAKGGKTRTHPSPMVIRGRPRR